MIIALMVGLMALVTQGGQSGGGSGLPQIAELRARIERHVESPDRKRIALNALDKLSAARADGFERLEARVKELTPVLLKQDSSEADLRGVATVLLAEEEAGEQDLLRLRGALHGVLTREEWLAVLE